MKKIEMVRCMVRSPRRSVRSREPEASQRYVPSEIFRLWRYLMEQVKGFMVFDVVTGVWVDQEMLKKDGIQRFVDQADKVIELSFSYCRETNVGRPVIRYFPEKGFHEIIDIFIKNFSKQHIRGGTQQSNGFFFIKDVS